MVDGYQCADGSRQLGRRSLRSSLLLGISLLAAPGVALASNECGAPAATTTCAPGVYPNGISYAPANPFTLVLQQTPIAAVDITNGGVNIAASANNDAALIRSLVGSATGLGPAPSIVNLSGAGVSLANAGGTGNLTVDLSAPAPDGGMTVTGSTDGIFVSGPGAVSVILTTGSVTAQNGSAIDVVAGGAANVATGSASLTAAGGSGISLVQTGSSGAITVTASGAINASSYQSGDGVKVLAQGPNNTDPISVTANGSIVAAGSGLRVETSSNRNITILSNGAISAQADGIFAETAGQGSVTITANGNVIGDSNSGGVGDAIDVATVGGAITLTTAANATLSTGASSPPAGLPDKQVISLVTTSGAVTVNNAAALQNENTASGFGSYISGIYATTVSGGVNIVNSGMIGSSASPLGRSGIDASITGAGQDLSITNTAAIYALDNAIDATNAGAGALNVSSSGAVTSLQANAINTTAGAGVTNVTVNGSVSAPDQIAVSSTSTTGAVNITVGSGASLSAVNSIGAASSGGSIQITTAGALTAGNQGVTAAISAGAGDISVTNSGQIIANGSFAISGDNGGSGKVAIVTTGPVSAVQGSGVIASALSGAVNVSVGGTINAAVDGVAASATSGQINISVGQGAALQAANGVLATTSAGGAITVQEQGSVTASNVGVFAVASGGGDVSVSNTGTISGTQGGVTARTTGSGAVSVTTGAAVSAGAGAGVATVSDAGATTIAINAGVSSSGNDAVFATTGTGALSISTVAGAALTGSNGLFVSAGGPVTISNDANVTGTYSAISVASTGSNLINLINTGALTGSGAAAVQLSTNSAADISLSSSGAVSDPNGFAIHTVAVSGSTTLSLSGQISAPSNYAVLSSGYTGAVNLSLTSGTISGSGGVLLSSQGAVGLVNQGTISASSTGSNGLAAVGLVTLGQATLTNASGGALIADGSTQQTASVAVVNATTTSVVNSGSIGTNQPNHSGYALYFYDTAGGASNTPTNAIANNASGTIDGAIVNANAGTLTVNNAGVWKTAITQSYFGSGGSSVVNNSGLIQVGLDGPSATAASSTSFAGLASLHNSGVLSLSNGVGGDQLYVSGSYIGSGGVLRLDFSAGNTAATDSLHIGGAATGATSVVLNVLSAPILVGKTPIIYAGAGSSPTAFTIASSHIGFTAYSIAFDPTRDVYSVVGAPDQAAFETLKFAEARHNLFYKSESAWSSHLQDYSDEVDRHNLPEGFNAWGQVYGGSLSRSDSSGFSGLGVTATGNGSYDQTYVGGQIGIDVSEILAGGLASIGVTSGYASSSVNFSATGDSLSIDEFNIGVYANYLNRGWRFSALLKFDPGTMHVDSPYAGYAQGLRFTQTGVTFEVSKRFNVNGWFLEPTGRITALVGATAGDGGATSAYAYSVDGASVRFANDTSVRGEIGLHAGAHPNPWFGRPVQPYAEVSVANEFTGGGNATFSNGATPLTLKDAGVGAYGVGRVGLHIWPAKRLMVTVEGEGNAGSKFSGGGARLSARYVW